MIIDHANLSRLDLNLLVAFDALMTERGVTRAAARVGLGQSAMSHNLARLRVLLGDELLTRAPEGMRPTPRALALLDPVRAALGQIQAAVLESAPFDPASARRAFRIGLPDSVEVALIPALLDHLSAAAPGVRLELRSVDYARVLDELDADRLDLGIGLFTEGQTHHKRRRLYDEGYVCMFSPERTGVVPPIALADYVRLPHVLTSLSGVTRGPVDDALATLGLRRTVALTTPHFLAVPFILRGAPAVATLPARLARLFAVTVGLAVSPAPAALPDFTISLLWHASYDHDPAHLWLRRTVARLAAETATTA